MVKELNSIYDNETWEEVDIPKDDKILDTKWVFSYKSLEKEKKNRYKARLVVRGFLQEKNYQNVYAPVAKMSTIRLLLIIGNQLKFYFIQLDVKNAFLNGIIEDDVFIYPPEGIQSNPSKVFKLKKSLYGLKQSSRCWNSKIDSYLLKIGFERSSNDYCLYVMNKTDSKVYILLYVDDIILSGPDLVLLNKIKIQLMTDFKMVDKGELRYFLGLEIKYDRDKGILRINQEDYISKLIKRFRMEDSKCSLIPIEPKLYIEVCKNVEDVTSKPYRELLGCIMYLMLGSRPDICFALNVFSRLQDKASDYAWNNLKRVVRYLKGTQRFGLEYIREENNFQLECFVDSDWGGDQSDRKSVSGFVFKLSNSTLMWATRKQHCVSLSSSEAELIALCSAASEGLCFIKLLEDFKIDVKPMLIHEDNQGCISILNNPANNRRVKHIDIKYNFVSECMNNNILKILYISTDMQLADLLTKGLKYASFVKFRNNLGVKNLE